MYTCKVCWDASDHKIIMIQRHDCKQCTLEWDWLWHCHMYDMEGRYSALSCTGESSAGSQSPVLVTILKDR